MIFIHHDEKRKLSLDFMGHWICRYGVMNLRYFNFEIQVGMERTMHTLSLLL